MEVSSQLHDPIALSPGEELFTHCTGGWLGLRANLDEVVKGKISQPLPRFEPPIIQLVAQRYTTELSRLLIPIKE
jgi:hypothetical protein